MKKLLKDLKAREDHIASPEFRVEMEKKVEKAFSSYHPSQYEGLHSVQKNVMIDCVVDAHRHENLLTIVALQQELLKKLS